MEARVFKLKEHSYPGLEYRMTLQTKKDMKNSLHTHDYYEFFLVTEGEVKHLINGEATIAKKGELYLIRPHDVHQLAIIEEGDEYLNLNFSKDVMDSLLKFWSNEKLNVEIENSFLPPKRVLNESDLKHVRERMLQTMFRESATAEEQTYVMKKRVFDIFSSFFAKTVPEDRKDVPWWLANAVEQMKKEENFKAGVSRMVEISGKSMEHLSRSMSKHYGYSPTKYVNRLRVDYMSSMLAYSTCPIIDIWLEAGFESAGYAYKLFKEYYGVTPLQYRKANKTGGMQ